MKIDTDIREKVRVTFRKGRKPGHFTNHSHCDECKEHDDVLRARNVNTLTIQDVGNPGWDPICYISPEGFEYYFPAFVRLTLAAPRESYLSQFLFHLAYEGARNRHFRHFAPQQREVVVAFLRHVLENHRDIVEEQDCEDELQFAISVWALAEAGA